MTTTYQSYADHHLTPRRVPRRVPLCEACNGHGMIGGLLPAGGGYESETCSECGGAGSCHTLELAESDGGEHG